MSPTHTSEDTMESFLKIWKRDYIAVNAGNPLFNTERVCALTHEQRQLFVRAFYHARGHFYHFLWIVGCFAPTEDCKNVVLQNIWEELGGRGRSHEQLYGEFAAALGVDMVQEMLSGSANLPSIQAFNRGHSEWLLRHDWDHKWAAFSAYELLDNVDYEQLYQLAVAMGISGRALLFFEVHRAVEHYDHASSALAEIWVRNPDAVRAGFDFIAKHQTQLWSDLAAIVYGYAA